jgi:hypothetical protein
MVAPKNESHPRHFAQIVSEYFVVQKKYLSFFIIYMNAAYCIGGIALIATGTMLVAYLKQACGMFKIAK